MKNESQYTVSVAEIKFSLFYTRTQTGNILSLPVFEHDLKREPVYPLPCSYTLNQIAITLLVRISIEIATWEQVIKFEFHLCS